MYRRETRIRSTGLTLQTENIVSAGDYQFIRTGQSVPKFRALIKSKLSATSPYSVETTNLRYISPFGVTSIRKQPFQGGLTYDEKWFGYYFNNLPTFNATDLSAADVLALTRAYKQLEKAQTHANGMQFLGELHEVITMFKHPYRSALNLVDKYISNVQKHRKRYRPAASPKARKRFEKAVADSWLETAFGLKPLISDVKDLAETAARFQYDSRREKAIGFAEVQIEGIVNNFGLGNPTNYIIGNCNEVKKTYAGVKYIAYLDWSRSAAFGSTSRLVELAGFRLDKFIPTLYELAPWSFLLDYFSNLGTVIETGCAAQSVVKFVVKTTQLRAEQNSTTYGIPANVTLLTINFSSNAGEMFLVRKRFVRSSSGLLSRVPFSLELPGSKTKWANIAALWISKSK